MNDEVSKTIVDTISGFQWILIVLIVSVLTYWLIKSAIGKKKK